MTDTQEQQSSFNFESHRKDAINAYSKVRPTYVEFAGKLESILKEALNSKNIKYLSVTSRAKSIESFGEKSIIPLESNPNIPKYSKPIEEISDIAGARVTTYFIKTISDVDKIISNEFEVIEKQDRGEILSTTNTFGYNSVHYLVRLKPERFGLPEYARFEGLIAEIQVRTILQHAWAEIEHDIRYKSPNAIPRLMQRRLASLAGMLEIEDREFQAIQDEDDKMRHDVNRLLGEGKLDQIPLTPDSLRAYLDKKLGTDERMSQYSYEFDSRILTEMNFSTLKQIEDCINAYDDDKLSRIVYYSRQGQLTRFELMLLAGMGQNYITKHPYTSEWFVSSKTEYLKKMQKSGIIIGNYSPV